MKKSRILIYSHDSFGLGHLRRCRAIAHALVERYKSLTVLILTGSPIAGHFNFKARVDFVRIPGVIKLYNGEYTPLKLHISLKETLALRESIILHTARIFEPDLFIVDKEPLGLKGEVASTLELLADTRTRTILGLRDVMDDADRLSREWQAKKALPALENLYDEIWVYGSRNMGDPLTGLPVSAAIHDKMLYTGYLPRHLPEHESSGLLEGLPDTYLLVTPGGGGDGAEMVDWVLRAYESGADLPWPALIMLGPFMSAHEQEAFRLRAAPLGNVHIATFDTQFESLMNQARAVVAMGGYNTFCEILSFDKPALLVPRTEPRMEQLIRARKAAALGLTTMLDPALLADTGPMVAALQRLPSQPPPSAAARRDMLCGLRTIGNRVRTIVRENSS